MKQFIITAVTALFALTAAAQTVKPGIEVLRDGGFKELQGKRVGLITNPTGVDSKLKSTIDILSEAPGVKLTALYSPEHGVRGDVHAGDKVETYIDSKTGVPVYSLYGKTRRPTAEMLENVDVVVYDIQDIGCRSYTFISTMGEVMDEVAKYGKEFMVLDRPNPIGGNIVEGNLVEPGFFSFVSQFKIPYLYGLTPGEVAKLLVGEKLINDKVKLTVIPMQGWNRDMDYSETGLEWIAPSPHIPHPFSAFYYPVTGILGELGVVSIGVGYTLPFQIFAFDKMDADKLADNLNAMKMEGVIFRPIHIKPFYSAGAGLNYQGVQVHLTDPKKARLSDIQFLVMQEMYKLNPDLDFFKLAPKRMDMWNKVCGTDFIAKEFGKNYDYSKIKDYWQKDEEAFKKLSANYYLYK